MRKQALVPTAFIGALLWGSGAQAQKWPATDPNFAGPQIVVVPTAEKFGQVGQLTIASDFSVDFAYTSVKPAVGPSSSATLIRVAPALDYFIVRNVAIGGVAGITYEKTSSGPSARTLEVGPEIGYAVLVSPRVSLFPKLGASYRNIDVSSSSALGGTISRTEHHVALKLAIPILVHPFEHLFLGAGPLLSYDILSRAAGQKGAKATSIALSFIIGGWF